MKDSKSHLYHKFIYFKNHNHMKIVVKIEVIVYAQIKYKDRFSYQIKHLTPLDIWRDIFFSITCIEMILIQLFLITSMVANLTFAGIDIPRDNCKWLDGQYGFEVKCDGNEVAVGACG